MLGRMEVGIFHVGRENPLIELAAASASRLGYSPVLLTDEKTPSPIPAFRREIDGELMVKNVGLQLEFLKQSGNTIFIDSDVLILKDVSEVFGRMEKDNCSIAFTWRDKKQFPINYGVIFATRKAVPFFEFILENVKSQSEDRRKWYANQFAVLDLFTDEQKKKIGRYEIIEHELGRILMLSCRKYNFSPENARKITDQSIVHFKGERKKFMHEVYNGSIQPE